MKSEEKKTIKRKGGRIGGESSENNGMCTERNVMRKEKKRKKKGKERKERKD